jgi:membrane dipeptidase
MENKSKILIADGHLDLSMNAMEWNRDLRMTTTEIRLGEGGMNDKPDRGKGTVSFPSMRDGNIRLCIATQIARYVRPGNIMPGWNSPEQAWAHTQGQLAWYRAMEEAGELLQIRNAQQLEEHLHLIDSMPEKMPAGYVLSLEGADSIISMKHLEQAYEYGLRAIGPAHFGPGTYAGGTNTNLGLGNKGRILLKEMDNLGIILDISHLSEESFREALDIFHGPVWASHNNCRKFVAGNRQLSDQQIKELIARDSVIGAVLDAWMLVPDWESGKSDPAGRNVTLKLVINNMDHVCQLAGDSRHVAIGSDLDGAFGKEQCPTDIDTIADLQKIPSMLKESGYSQDDIYNIAHGNWIRFLRKNLPDS